MINAFFSTLGEHAVTDSRVAFLYADSGPPSIEKLKAQLPGRVFNTGVSEVALLGVAAGLAQAGMRPVALGLASFLLQRAFEFVRNDICIPCANVKLVGIGGGFAFSHMGVSHHATEDVGLARLLPSLEVCVPATPSEVAHWVRVLSDDPRPWYIRLAANDPHALEDEAMAAAPDSFGIREWMDGTDVVLIAVGPIVREVLDAAKLLIARGIRPRVLSAALLAPLTAGAIVKYVAPAHTVVVAEDHQRVGGFGEVIEQSVIASDQRARVVRLGVQGMPGEAHGTLQTLRQYYQLDARAIYAAAARTGD